MLDAIRCACPRLPVIILSGRLDQRPVALAAGADLFVCKADPPERLLAAIASVQCGRHSFHAPLVAALSI
jgi:DNA-binding NarL/FixJ family response regulator